MATLLFFLEFAIRYCHPCVSSLHLLVLCSPPTFPYPVARLGAPLRDFSFFFEVLNWIPEPSRRRSSFPIHGSFVPALFERLVHSFDFIIAFATATRNCLSLPFPGSNHDSGFHPQAEIRPWGSVSFPYVRTSPSRASFGFSESPLFPICFFF